MIVLCHPWLRKELNVLRPYLNLLIIEIRYIVLEKRQKTYVANILSLCGTFYSISMFCTKLMDLWDYTMVKEQGTRNTEQGTRNENCTRTRHRQQGLANGANVEIFSNSFCTH